MKRHPIIIGLLLCLTINSEATLYTLLPSDDTFAQSRQPNVNFGFDPRLRVEWAFTRGHVPDPPPPDLISDSYLKFDLSEIPDHERVVRATLNLFHAGGVNVDFQKRIDVHYVADDSWAENTLTWNNKPNLTAFIASFVIKPTGWNSWDLSAHDFTADWLDNRLSLALITSIRSTAQHRFASKETISTALPALEIETAPIPEPSALFLFTAAIGGMLGSCWFRRKQTV